MSFKIKEGLTVYYLEDEYIIRKILNFEELLAEDVKTNQLKTLKIKELKPNTVSEEPRVKYEDITQINTKHLEKAKMRLEAIKPILNTNSRKIVERRAKETGISTTSLYNWMKAYESTEQLSSLVLEGTKGGKNKSRLSKEQNAIIETALNEYFLSKIKPSKQSTWEEIAIKCKNADIKIPSLSSISRRIDKISEKKAMSKREGKKELHKLIANQGNYPDGIYPLHMVQIDHTLADVILVDDKYRLELGRPWVTLAIDIFSRMVTGYHISFESPGYYATGQTIAMSILSKDEILEKYDIKSKWPVFGVISNIHADNAKEFRGNDIKNVCEEYGMNLIWRPVGRPHYGGHIERLIGTFNKRTHTINGTTFSGIAQKREYNPQKEASMTLKEFTEWFTILITEFYHNSIHSELGMTPLQKYNEGIFGSATQPPIGLPPMVEDEKMLKLNFLPSEQRTIQKYGIQLDNINYYGDILNYWVNAKDSKTKQKRAFTIRRDPWDISRIWFYDPTTKRYYEIPYRNISFPAITLWEYRAILKNLKHKDDRTYNEIEIFNALERMKNIQSNSEQKTKKQQSKKQRKSIDRSIKFKARQEENPYIDKTEKIEQINENDVTFNMFDDIEAYNDIEG